MNWKRVIWWSLIAVLSTYAIALLSGVFTGVVIAHSDTDPATVHQIAGNGRIIRRIAVALVVIACFWRLGAGTSRNRIAHIVAAFLLIRVADLAISLLLGAPPEVVVQPQGHLWAVLYAIVGYLLSRLRPNNSFKPKPLRGSAQFRR